MPDAAARKHDTDAVPSHSAGSRRFAGSFTQQDPLPQASLDAALAVLTSSRLHRYNLDPGEVGETAQLEVEVAAWQGRRYCLAVTSGGQAIQIALRAAGVARDDRVLLNAFTLAPVPGAIEAVGAGAVLVESDDTLRIDLADLEAKQATSGARFLLLSHMRGHLPDMEAIVALADRLGLTLIEDCAHSMGASFRGVKAGNHGLVSCFSTQTYKHMNSGEGGFLVSDDAELMARATILSGSYMHYARHGAGPDAAVFSELREETPNLSARLDALRAAVLRPQLPLLDDKVAAWNRLHAAAQAPLGQSNLIHLPVPLPGEQRVGSSLQFRVPSFDLAQCRALVDLAGRAGVELKWFGDPTPHGFTSSHGNWRYIPAQSLPQTDRVLATLFDLRLPLSFDEADCRLIGEIIRDSVAAAAR